MSSVSNALSDLTTASTTQPYSVSANVGDNGVDVSSSKITGGDGTTGTTTKKADQTMGKDDFLQLLITQLRYQDPLSPMDNTQFVAQLAQFQQLEGTNNIQKAIDNLGSSFKESVNAQTVSADSLASTAAISLIGKSVRMQVKTLDWNATAGEKIDLPIYLGDNGNATVQIEDSKGTVVKTMTASGKDNQNSVQLSWDGTTDDGGTAPAGSYTIHIVGQEKDSSLYAFVEDVVTGVRFSGSTALVKIHGTELPLSNILDVSSGSAAGGGGQMLSQGSAVSLIGKEIRVLQTAVTYSHTSSTPVSINVNAPAGSSVRVNICDANGNTVQTLDGTANDKGVASLSWTGQNLKGTYVSDGQYGIQIVGADQNPQLYSFIEGKVDGVSNLPGSTTVRVGGLSFDLGDIVDISDAG
jgi:flagellar basal-body rod modification protein FlgD